MVEVPLKLRRLKPGITPSIFPGCPTYLSQDKSADREAPEEKRARLEAKALQEALQQSLITQQEEEKNNSISSFEDLLCHTDTFLVGEFWSKVVLKDKVHFLNLAPQDAPVVRCAVVVNADLSLKVYFGETRIEKVGTVLFPVSISDVRQLADTLDRLEEIVKGSRNDEGKVELLLRRISALLEELSASQFPSDWQAEVLKFLRQQVEIVLSNAIRYPAELLVFASIMFTISPHAYKFMRSTSKLKLPHPNTIRRVCAAYSISPSLEQQDELYLSYAKKMALALKDHEKTVTLMIDEIHLQSYFEYKGGFVTGAATNSNIAARTAYVFMIQSLLSPNKDVVHILPVAKLDAKDLHIFLVRLIKELEDAGLQVIAVISDNNSINRKAMSFFSDPPKCNIVYAHPSDPSRPLFFVLDSVHILKCIRNNWLNQRNPGTCMFFPDITELSINGQVLTASFGTLRKAHEQESNELLRLAPTLSLKALNPSNLERQNVKLVLKIFNLSTIAALTSSTLAQLQHAKGTAEFIRIILTWWNIVNVKTPHKGQRLRDSFQEPVRSMSSPQIDFLNSVIDWLDFWESLKHDAGHLTRETHSAFRHTSHALVEVTRYCIEELGFSYVLLGKFQTDCLEDRFGKYRQLSGAQYHVSIRQIYESEHKLRLQKVLELPELPQLDVLTPCGSINDPQDLKHFDVAVSEQDVAKKQPMLPAITYVAGYCAHAATKKLACTSCKENLVLENRNFDEGDFALIATATTGGLMFPQPVVVHAVLTMDIVLEQLVDEKNATKFYDCPKQKELLVALTSSLIDSNEDLDTCDHGHSPQLVMKYIFSAAANVLLNNLCKQKNDKLTASKQEKKRKMKTLES